MFIQTIKNIKLSIKALLVFTLMTGVLYPLLVTAFAKIIYPEKSNGSLIRRGDTVIGSEWIGQKFSSPRYFQPRPSASDYGTMPSGASNLSATSEALRASVSDRKKALGSHGTGNTDIPSDLLTASGSGLDPHISPEAAQFQVDRILTERGLALSDRSRIIQMIEHSIEAPQLGFLGKSRVNVLKLNLLLDEKLK